MGELTVLNGGVYSEQEGGALLYLYAFLGQVGPTLERNHLCFAMAFGIGLGPTHAYTAPNTAQGG